MAALERDVEKARSMPATDVKRVVGNSLSAPGGPVASMLARLIAPPTTTTLEADASVVAPASFRVVGRARRVRVAAGGNAVVRLRSSDGIVLEATPVAGEATLDLATDVATVEVTPVSGTARVAAIFR